MVAGSLCVALPLSAASDGCGNSATRSAACRKLRAPHNSASVVTVNTAASRRRTPVPSRIADLPEQGRQRRHLLGVDLPTLIRDGTDDSMETDTTFLCRR
ncbi:hypothetical protein ONA91_31745 [Micromonospora sp. DR5-3]|uniref:hypothetical protein n=1 Tax=unclassified Micromonospora TaxID=2617518 RepID=UPI0011D550BC|nr:MULTISPECIES: hypothetical protein [unclassified Micromonospora]MCW3819021.1 hypothetical protein [Micromonospora sp. DR5-3]TYC19752.1 hypothetical protein FXF52_34900 [Micromonospora sp. MP36]